MTYVLVDPFLLSYPTAGQASAKEAKAYLDDLLAWSRTVDRVHVDWRVSSACKHELNRLYGSLSQMRVELQKLLEQSGLASDQVTLDKALRHFFNDLLADPYIDLEVDKTRTDEIMLWEVTPDGVKVEPSDHVTRLADEDLKRAYKQTLGDVTFAWKNKVRSISELGEIYIASRKHAGSQHPEVRVNAQCVICVDNKVKSAESLSRQRSVEGTYSVVYSLDELADRVGKRKRFKSVFDAVRAAVELYPDVLVFPSKAQDTARKSSFEDPNEIFEIVSGLVTVWLPTYRQRGNNSADAKFYEKYSRHYSPFESDSVENDPMNRRDYTVKYENEEVFCRKHIKLGIGSNCARVNFELIETIAGPKIVLARAGRHGRNTKT